MLRCTADALHRRFSLFTLCIPNGHRQPHGTATSYPPLTSPLISPWKDPHNVSFYNCFDSVLILHVSSRRPRVCSECACRRATLVSGLLFCAQPELTRWGCESEKACIEHKRGMRTIRTSPPNF